MKTRILILLLFALAGADCAYAIPMPSQTFYGNAYVNETRLTQSDSGYAMSLVVEGRTLATYTMGDYESDYYALSVPLDTDCSVTNAACIGDSAYIYINGKPINENPLQITEYGAQTRVDISTGVYVALEITPANVDIVPGNTGYATAHVTPAGAHKLEVESLICKDTNKDNFCESILINPSAEISIVFDDTRTLTATTDSSGNAGIRINMDSSATQGARYVYRIKTKDGGWKEAEAIAETNTAIPEYPSAALPAAISMITYGLMRKRLSLK